MALLRAYALRLSDMFDMLIAMATPLRYAR